MSDRKIGRPSTYGFEDILVGQIVPYEGVGTAVELIRRAALAHARRCGKIFATRKMPDKILIKRIE